MTDATSPAAAPTSSGPGVFALDPSAELMASAPLVHQLHALAAFGLFAIWPFTRLVHVFSLPLAYLWRPYVVYRRRPDGVVVVPPQVPRPAVHFREHVPHC